MREFIRELKRRNVVRVAIAYLAMTWLIIQVVETLFPIFGLSNISIRIIVIILLIGFPVVLVFSWVYELTPEGLRLEKDIDRSKSITHHTGTRLDRAIIVALSLAVTYFAVDKFLLEPSRDADLARQVAQEARSDALTKSYGDLSIAVLPFENMSSDQEQEYFSDGISEELLNLLAQVPELRVISRTSAFSFKGKNLEIPEISRRLNVAHILEGSVRKSGRQMRITAQLIEARSDTHLWSETYDRPLDDIFAVQDEIAGQIVARLKQTLLNKIPDVQTVDPEAYTLYLQGRHFSRQHTEEGYQQAIEYYERALHLYPEFPNALTALAAVYLNQEAYGYLSAEEAAAKSTAAANRALAIDASDPAARGILGWALIFETGDLAGAAEHLRIAIAAAPRNSNALSNSAALLQMLNRPKEATAIRRYLVDLDPVRSASHYNLGATRLYGKDYEGAIESFQTALKLNPGMYSAWYNLGVAHLLNGDVEAALVAFEQEPAKDYRNYGLSMALQTLGRVDEADEVYSRATESIESAGVLAFRGYIDEAFGLLQQHIEAGGSFFMIAGDPLYLNAYDDPRWIPFLRKVGMAPEQLNAIEFEVEIP